MSMTLKEADKKAMSAEEIDKGYLEAMGYRGKGFFDTPAVRRRLGIQLRG